MPFIANDLYLTSGTASVFNYWAPNVTKHDTSSFYNWEQDNFPIYDLEERTDLLWEKLGFPVQNGFSGIPGIMFAVSADAPFAGESSGAIFKSVSAVINILPEVITLPIIIEVASFGSLGELNLNNLKFKDNGGLEIINRNFVKVFGQSSNGRSSRINATTLSSLDSEYTMRDASCIGISTKVISSISPSGDTRFNTNNILYYTRSQGSITAFGLPTSAYYFRDYDITTHGAGVRTMFAQDYNGFKLNGAGYGTSQDLTVSADIVPYNQATETVNPGAMRRDPMGSSESVVPVTGYFYGNWFTKVTVNNCNGNLYIRNFAVDGGSGSGITLVHTTDNGYEINNSKLVLENALASRCNNAGVRINNSDVTVARGLVTIRNYELSSASGRTTKKVRGWLVNNSTITLSATPYVSGAEAIFHSTWNDIGIELNSSRLIGGQSRKTALYSSSITYLQSFFNTDTGIKLSNSYLEAPGRIDVFNNTVGVHSVNSNIKANELTSENHNRYGLILENSVFEYNQDLNKHTAVTNDHEGQVMLQLNGINALLENSVITYTDGDDLPSKYGVFLVDRTIGAVKTSAGFKTSLPNIQVFNGSNLKIIHPYINNNQTGSNLQTTYPIYGLLASVRNNSKATFIGSKDFVSRFIGPGEYSKQPKIAGLAADNGSIIEFQGPTLIGNLGVGVLGENQSVINFTPHRDVHGNLLTSAFQLNDPLNHTKVEVHSTRACIVVNKKSVLNMQDLGDYNALWPASTASAGDYNYQNTYGTASAVSGGYMQFYPNGQNSDAIALSGSRSDIESNFASVVTNGIVNAGGYILLDFNNITANSEILKLSTGGVCVRVMNGSIATVKNVNFPCGWDNTSGILYDASGGNCDLLRIWNIGSDSELDASFLSVSGKYPSLVGYNGPSAVYVSGGAVVSAAPSWVPDTGILSVLDPYGPSGSASGTNYGPFRLYVSVDGPVKLLGYLSSTGIIYNSPYQMLSQGYNPYGSLSAPPQVSSYYSNLNVSTFLTTSAVIDPGYRGRVRLDQSAADTFANAKNGAIAKSGRVPFCTIYRSNIDEGSEGYETPFAGDGLGLLSVNIFDLSRTN